MAVFMLMTDVSCISGYRPGETSIYFPLKNFHRKVCYLKLETFRTKLPSIHAFHLKIFDGHVTGYFFHEMEINKRIKVNVCRD